MAEQRIATRTMFYNADKTKLVPEDSPEAALLFVRAGSPIQDIAEAERLGYSDTEPHQLYNAAADHAARHGAETQQQADARRAAMFEGDQARGGEDPDGPPVEGERGEKADAPKRSKAVERAPANKSK